MYNLNTEQYDAPAGKCDSCLGTGYLGEGEKVPRDWQADLRYCEQFEPTMTVRSPAWKIGWPAAIRRLIELERLIRWHRDQRGDDRCHLDDGILYSALPEGDTRPASDTAVTIENCQRFIEARQQGREYISPQRRIEELECSLRDVCNLALPYVERGALAEAWDDLDSESTAPRPPTVDFRPHWVEQSLAKNPAILALRRALALLETQGKLP